MSAPQREATATELELALLDVHVRARASDPDLVRRLALCYGASQAAPDPAARRIEAVLERAPAGWRIRVDGRDEALEADPVLALRRFHHELLHAVMLARPDLYFVHAAVVELEGLGLVLPGLSQAGKSTLALGLLQRGARYLSDELLAFDPRAELALSFPRAPKIRDACVDYFPAYAGSFVGSSEGRILPFDAHPAPPLGATRVAAIVVPRWAGVGHPVELRPITPGEALLALTASSLNFGTHRARSLDSLTALARRASAWRLAWGEPHAAAERVVATLRAMR